MPRSIAFFSAGTSASLSLAEMAMASTFCAISELITSIWPSAVGVGRAGVDDLDVAEFLGGFLRALVGGLEEADAERLHDQRDAPCSSCAATGPANAAAARQPMPSSVFQILISSPPVERLLS